MKYSTIARFFAGVFVMTLLTACSTPQTLSLKNTASTDLAARAELNEVVYFPQDDYQCGPASLAMVLQSNGARVEPQQLKEYLYIPEKQGSLQIEMLAAARRHGMTAYVLQAELHDVLTEVSAGNPVIVLQNLAFSWYPRWHFAVVIGYDLGREEIILRSGSNRRLVLPFSTFEHTWARGKYWAMVVLPPPRIPQTATAAKYIQSLDALLYSNPKGDLTAAYAAAEQRWPGNLLVAIASGNHAYTRGDIIRAEQIFRSALAAYPDSAAIMNNLAQVLSDQGQLEEALQTIQRAIQTGGPLLSVMQQTLTEIVQKIHAKQ